MLTLQYSITHTNGKMQAIQKAKSSVFVSELQTENLDNTDEENRIIDKNFAEKIDNQFRMLFGYRHKPRMDNLFSIIGKILLTLNFCG